MPYFKQDDVHITGALKSYERRSDESQRVLPIEFCLTCGTTISMTAEVFPASVPPASPMKRQQTH